MEFDMMDQRRIGFAKLLRGINTEQKALAFFKHFKMLPKGRCEHPCSNNLLLKINDNTKTGYSLYCYCKCHVHPKKINPLAGTWFGVCNISFLQHFDILIHWFFKIKSEDTILNVISSSKTVTKMDAIINQVCRTSNKKFKQIGGRGIQVELDETFMFKRKYGRGKKPRDCWLFGGVERTTARRVFLIQIKNRKRETLFSALSKYVAKGSLIVSDEFASYKGVESLGYLDHSTVCHKYEFVNHDFPEIHTNGIECQWSKVKGFCRRSGKPRAVNLYIARFLYKRRLELLYGPLNKGVKFQRLLSDIKRLYRGPNITKDMKYSLRVDCCASQNLSSDSSSSDSSSSSSSDSSDSRSSFDSSDSSSSSEFSDSSSHSESSENSA